MILQEKGVGHEKMFGIFFGFVVKK